MNEIVKRLRKLSLNLKVTRFVDGLDQYVRETYED